MDDPRDPRHAGGADAREGVGGAGRGDAAEAIPDDAEIEVWRSELARANEALELARAELAAAEDRALRARADLENLRRRHAGELERARQQGQDAALRPVLAVHDDLERALVAARQTDDPTTIVPGVEAVFGGLLRALEGLGLERTGFVGEPFDATRHEAILAVPPADTDEPGTIRSVFEAGFVQGDRLVRPARVVVVQEP